MEHIVFLTGHLARPALERVLAAMQPSAFSHSVLDIGVQVAALMTTELVRRRVSANVAGDRILLPGRCRADLETLSEHFGRPVQRGPDELKDLPRFFDPTGAPRAVDLSLTGTRIFAEIVDAPRLDLARTLARARALVADGADVIDLGCLPDTPYPHLEEAVRALKAAGFQVSVDSLDPQELLRGGRAGADHLLSLSVDSLWIADELPQVVPVLIPRQPDDTASLDAAIAGMRARGRAFLADPILDPIPFGFAASIVRAHALRQREPGLPMMLGIGNLTELTEADTSGQNALLMGLCAELGVAAVLTTQVSGHARHAVREADLARRVMHAAARDRVLPKGLSRGLMTVHDKHPHPDSAQEIADQAADVRDPNFRIQVSAEGLHVYNRDGLRREATAMALWPQLGLQGDAAHAFYMGYELALAETAYRLGKRYVQDRGLDWGCAADAPAAAATDAACAPGTTRARPSRPHTDPGAGTAPGSVSAAASEPDPT